MGLLVFYALISILFSFICSILEAVLLSVTPTFINVKKQEGKSYANALELLKKDVDKPLIAILTLNTIAHTVGAILVGVQAEKVFGNGNNAIMIVSSVMTFLILVVSEIIPKTIGATYWKQLARSATILLNGLIFFFKWTGIIWIMQWFTKLFGKAHHGSVLSREDFSAMAEIAEEEGVFQGSESTVIKNLLKFDEILAKDVMTPRTVIKMAPENQTIQEFFDKNQTLRFSRIPIYQDVRDNITGLVLKNEVLQEIINGNGKKPLSEIKRNVILVPRSLPIPKLFEQLVETKNHMALVVDEFGAISGLVTMEDVIETLLGLEIMDESDNVEDMQALARKRWEDRAKRLGLLDE